MPEATRTMKPIKPDDLPYLQALTERITYHTQQWERLQQEALQHDRTSYFLQMVKQRAANNDACKGMLATSITDELDLEVAQYVKQGKRHSTIRTLLEDELSTFLMTHYHINGKNQAWNLDLAKKALYRMPPVDLNGGGNGQKDMQSHEGET